MFEKIKNALKKLIFGKAIDEEEVNKVIKEIQRAMIIADVPVNIVLEFTKKVKERIKKESEKFPIREVAIKAIYDELVRIVGEGREIEIKEKPFVIMLIGLFGSGKTTTAGKLAKFFKSKGYKVALVAADTFRIAAIDQLRQVANKAKVDCLYSNEKESWKVIEKVKDKFKNYDIVIIDSSGRDALSDEMIEELKKILKVVNVNLKLLVIPAELGKMAKEEIEGFNKVGIDGVIVTRMEGSAKGGSAIVACKLAKVPIYFVGTGEKLEDLEKFNANRYISRLLGFGDLESLLEKFKSEINEDEAKSLEEKIMKGKVNFIDLYKQIDKINKFSFSKLISFIPGLSFFSNKNLLNLSDEKIKKYKVIIQSMSKEELVNPSVLDNSRIKRIAYGSGSKEEEVREVIALLKKINKVGRMMKGKNLNKFLKKLGIKDLSELDVL